MVSVTRKLLFPLLFIAASSRAAAQDLLRIGEFSRDALRVVADDKGFLKAEAIRVEATSVGASVELMRNLADGTFDVVHTNADNVIAWAEGQGADPQPHDFMIFIGGRRGLGLDLVVSADVSSFSDLKGRVLAVDATNTGYSPVLVYLLKKHDLILNQDYTMTAVGGGRARLEALKRGTASGGFVVMDDELKRRGFHVLARADEYVPVYAVGVGATRRVWASQHEELLVRYVRALVRSADWLRNPANKTAALQILRGALGGSAGQAEEVYRASVDPRRGLGPRGQIDREAIKVVLRLREGMEQMTARSPDKYIDERYYQKAIQSLRMGSKQR